MLTPTQKVDIRRMLGYPAQGISPNDMKRYPDYGSQFGMWQPYVVLENRMSSLSQDEEVTVMGSESTAFGSYLVPASIALHISTPLAIATGSDLELDLNGALVVVASAAADTPTDVARKLAAAINQDPTASQTFLAAAVGAVCTAYARALGTDGNGYSAQAISTHPSLLVQIGVPAPSQYAVGMTAGGTNPPGPYFIPEGLTQPVYGYVPTIRVLDNDVANSRSNLDLTSAGKGDYVARPDELQGRKALLFRYRRQLADFLNVPIDPDLLGNRRSRNQRYR